MLAQYRASSSRTFATDGFKLVLSRGYIMCLTQSEERTDIMEKENINEIENIVTNPSPTHNTLLTKKTGSNAKKMVAVAVGCFLVGGVAGIGGTLAVERFVVRPHARAVRMVDADGNYIGRSGRTKKSDGDKQANSGSSDKTPSKSGSNSSSGSSKSGQSTSSKSNKARSNRSTDSTPGDNSSGNREDGKARFRDAAKAKRAEKNGQTSPANGTDQTQTTTTGGGANEN